MLLKTSWLQRVVVKEDIQAREWKVASFAFPFWWFELRGTGELSEIFSCHMED